MWSTCTCSIEPCIHVLVNVPRPGEIVTCSASSLCAILWKHGLSLNLEVDSAQQASATLLLPQHWVTGACSHAWPFIWMLRT